MQTYLAAFSRKTAASAQAVQRLQTQQEAERGRDGPPIGQDVLHQNNKKAHDGFNVW